MPKKVSPTAYVLINCDLDHKDEVMMEVSQLPGIIELAELDAAYDILVKLRVETVEELKETVKGHLRKMPHIRNTLALVAIEPRGSYAEEASFWIGIAVVKYSVYPNGTTMVYVACSNNPFKLEDEADEISLYPFLVFTLS